MNLSEKRNRRPYYVFLELVQATAPAQVTFSLKIALLGIYLIKATFRSLLIPYTRYVHQPIIPKPAERVGIKELVQRDLRFVGVSRPLSLANFALYPERRNSSES